MAVAQPHRINLLNAWTVEEVHGRLSLNDVTLENGTTVAERCFNRPSSLQSRSEISLVVSGIHLEKVELNQLQLECADNETKQESILESIYPIRELKAQNQLRFWIPSEQKKIQPKVWLEIRDG